MNHILTIFLAWGSSDSVAKRIMRQTSDLEDCGSNLPGGECIYTNVKKLGLAGIRTRIVCVEVEHLIHYSMLTLALRDDKKLVLPIKLKYITFYVLAPVSLFIPILTGLQEGTRSKQT